MYTLTDLKNEFDVIRGSSMSGVVGVVVFDSGKSGPRVGITMQTHGNEPAGLASLRYFRENNLVEKLEKGSVMFVLNNIAAATRYFESLSIKDLNERTEASAATRFLDVNMNRLLPCMLENMNDQRSEVVRARELFPIWKQFDVGLDIHTTRTVIEPMIIALHTVSRDLYRGFPANIIISNIENIQMAKPACFFYGQCDTTPVIGVEAGTNEAPESCDIAVRLMMALLQNLGILPEEQRSRSEKRKEYFITDALLFPNESYQLVKVFTPFELLKAGSIIALGDGEPIKIKSTSHIIMPPPTRKSGSPLSDEVLFLSSRVKDIG